MAMRSQRELEARYAGAVSAKAACFVYAEGLEAAGRLGPAASRPVRMLADSALRVPDLRVLAMEAHSTGRALCVDNTVPSSFGCHPLEQGADVSLESLDFARIDTCARGIVAIASRVALPCASDALSAADCAAVEAGLDALDARMQRRFDGARALAEYLSCCDDLTSVSYPGLSSHPDHDVAARVLRHGFGPLVDFELPASWGISAETFIKRCGLHEDRLHPACGFSTRLHARDGRDALAVRIVVGLDDPLAIADDLDQAMRWFRNPPEP